LKSTRPVTALEMRKDLKHWDQAMKLAAALAPEALPDINREYGAQLEMKGDHNMALQCYERALDDGSALSEAAVARCARPDRGSFGH
jgi:WD repeat-containing protein 19